MRVKNITVPECECNLEGSTNGNVCDQTTGSCTCKPEWSGNKCQGKLNPITQYQYQRMKMHLL